MGKACTICSADAKTLARVNEMIANGAAELVIAKANGFSRSAVNRHRTNHILATAVRIAQAAAKGAGVREQRELAIRAAETGERDPAAWLALESVVGDLREVHNRLQRSAALAEANEQLLTVGALSAQQLRAVETRARLGQIGNYAPQKIQQGGELGQQFVVNFHFSGGRTEHIETTIDASPAPPAIDMPMVNLPAINIDLPPGLGATPVAPQASTISMRARWNPSRSRAAQIPSADVEEDEDDAEDERAC